MIGYYAHGQGYGHSNYADLMADRLGSHLAIFTDSDFNFRKKSRVIKLPNEDVDGTELKVIKCEKPKFLHHNPLGLKKIQQRSHTILDQVIYRNIRLMLVDVSVEVATLCRVSSIPYAYRRMPGERNDLPHLEAYRGAVFLFAYYPKSCESSSTPDWVVDKTYYLGFIGENSIEKSGALGKGLESIKEIENILVIQGKGGHNLSRSRIEKLIKDFRSAQIHTIGCFDDVPEAANYTHHGFVDNIKKYVQQADVIFTACGSSTVSNLLGMGRKFICMPQNRPFNEQDCIGDFLVENKLAVKLYDNQFTDAIHDFLKLDPYIKEEFQPTDMSSFATACIEYHDRLESHENQVLQ
ncbi:MAG: glycosyltransferase [Nonlabens sp.]